MRRTGEVFEQRARAHLEAAGLHFVAQNFNTRLGELDLVMRDGNTLVFVEVRYRKSSRFGGAAMSVTRTKQTKLVHAAQLFLQAHPKHARGVCRFDVVTYEGPQDALRCQWHQAAFDAF